jgi:hypothetical protein
MHGCMDGNDCYECSRVGSSLFVVRLKHSKMPFSRRPVVVIAH